LSRKSPKLIFIQSIAEQERRLDREISSEAKSAISTLQRQPKPYYTIQDVESLVESLKTKMQTLNKEAHTEFSKKGFRGLDIKAVSSLDDTETLISIDELETIKRELDQYKEKAEDGKHLEMRIEDLEILLSEKESEITDLKSQSGLVSGKVQDQIKNLNLLQEELDEAKRVAKQEKQDREKMEAEFETVGNALMTTRLEIEELQQALGNKDIEIGNLKSEVQILSNNAEENIILKERQEELKKKIEQQETLFSKELDAKIAESSEKIERYEKDIKKHSNQLNAMQGELEEYKKRINQLEQENEDLLLDSGETSQEAVSLGNELEETKQILSEKEDENRNLNIRLEKSEKELQALSEENKNRKHEYEELKEKHDQINQELSRKVEDLEIDLKGKEERIKSIEKDRNELREISSDIKIEREKQKSLILDLETQLSTKDHELSERSKDLENLRSRQAEIVQEASESRSKHAEIERERDNYESKIKSLQEQLEEKELVNERLEKKADSINSELKTKEKEISALNKSKQSLETSAQNLKEAVETLRINLAKIPKYAILFVLQDIQQASISELAKTVAIQQVFAERLMKELTDEGWVSFDEISGTVTLKKALLELE
jgi:chromosome segregation ATPase